MVNFLLPRLHTYASCFLDESSIGMEQIIDVSSSGLKLVYFADHLSSDLPGPLHHGG